MNKKILFAALIFIICALFCNAIRNFYSNKHSTQTIQELINKKNIIEKDRDNLKIALEDVKQQQKDYKLKEDSFNLVHKDLNIEINKLKLNKNDVKKEVVKISNDSTVLIFNDIFKNLDNNLDSANINIGKMKDAILSKENLKISENIQILYDSMNLSLIKENEFLKLRNEILYNGYEFSLIDHIKTKEDLVKSINEQINLNNKNDHLRKKVRNRNRMKICIGGVAILTTSIMLLK